MDTFFAHHNATHDGSSRALFVTAAALVAVLAVAAVLVWKGSKK